MFKTIRNRLKLSFYLWEHSTFYEIGRSGFPSIECILSFKPLLPLLDANEIAPLDFVTYEMEMYFPSMEHLLLAIRRTNTELKHGGEVIPTNVQVNSTTGLQWLSIASGKSSVVINREILSELSVLIVFFEDNPTLKTRRLNGLLYRLVSDLNQWLLLIKQSL